MTCTVTIFGRPLSEMTPANAECARSWLAELDDCSGCREFRQRRIDREADLQIQIAAMDAWYAVAGVPDPW